MESWGWRRLRGRKQWGRKGMQEGGFTLPGVRQDRTPVTTGPSAGGPWQEVPTGQSQFRESQLALCHHLPATLILQELDTFRILAKLGGGMALGFSTPAILSAACV